MRTHRIAHAEWGRRETFALIRAWVTPWRHSRRLERLRRELEARLDGATVLPLNSARAGLQLLLAQLRRERPERSEVVVPDYVCASVIEGVLAAGCRPLPVAVDRELNLDSAALERLLGEREPLAVIAAHMYAAPAAIESIELHCRQAGVPLIDDAAQVLGVEVGGRPLGGFGDYGLLSFAQSKTVVTGNRGSGGAVVCRDPVRAEILRQAMAELPSSRHRLRRLGRFWLSHLAGKPGHALAWRLDQRERNHHPDWRDQDFEPARMGDCETALALAQLDSLTGRVAGKARAIAALVTACAERPDLQFPQWEPERYLTRLLVRLPAGTDRERLRAELREGGVQTRLPYDLSAVAEFGTPSLDPSLLLELPLRSTSDDTEIRDLATKLCLAVDRQRPLA